MEVVIVVSIRQTIHVVYTPASLTGLLLNVLFVIYLFKADSSMIVALYCRATNISPAVAQCEKVEFSLLFFFFF